MTLEEIQELAERDLKIDDSILDIESLKTPELHHKYLKLYTNFSLLLKKSEANYKKIYREKIEYYSGKSEPQVYKENPLDLKILKNDIPIYLDSDEVLNEAKLKMEYYKVVVNYLEHVIKMMNNRGFQIKNAIDFKRFCEGLN